MLVIPDAQEAEIGSHDSRLAQKNVNETLFHRISKM
jgi:hypothetical protein